MSFLSSIVEAILADRVLDAVGDYRDQKRQQQEQQRKDELFWQDAARRKE